MNYQIPGTKLPDLTPETTFITTTDTVPRPFGARWDYKGLISFGFTTINNEIYIKAERPTYTSIIHYLVKLSDIKALVKSYKLIKSEYHDAACKIAGVNNITTFMVNSAIYFPLQKAGVLDLWFEPVYHKFEIGEWVKWTGMNPAIGRIITMPNLGNCYGLEVNGKSNSYDSCDEKYLTYATLPEIIEALSECNRGLRFNRIEENIKNADKGWNNPEKTFAAEWTKEVEIGILENLLTNNQLKIDITPEIKVATASIIQWLGSNVGMSFVKDVLDKEGYAIVHKLGE